MLKKKLLIVVASLGLLFFANDLQASAVAKGNPDDLKIDKKANEEAVAIVENQGGLETSPVSAENLTTQQPQTLSQNMLFRSMNQKAYIRNQLYRREIRCNYLAPVGFTWADNGIPFDATRFSYNNTFIFNSGNVTDTGVGGYGTGGYYWRRFKSRLSSGTEVYYWLSAWNKTHLIYG